ncbi:MAG: hypothetical protein AB4372_16380 [Xenococcus sp. (in: cyanobacteria)]
MLSKFRNLYPTASILSELIDIDRGTYIVKVSIQIQGITLATGLAGAEVVEKAEDSARNRALQALVLEDGHLSLNLATKADSEVAKPLNLVTETSHHHDSLTSEKSTAQEMPQLPLSESKTNSTAKVTPEQTVTATIQPPVAPVIISEYQEPSVNKRPEPEPEALPIPPQPEIPAPSLEYQEEIFQPTLESPSNPADLPPVDPTWSEKSSQEPLFEEQGTVLTATLADPVLANEESEPLAKPQVTESPVEFDFNQIRHKIDLEMKRLSWTKEQGRDYLLSTYGKRSRLHLTDDELLEFWHYLETLPN